jgi:hypothetical protein
MAELEPREADQARREANREKALRRHERDQADLRWVTNRPEGRRFLWRLLNIAGTTSSPAGPNDMITNRLIGRQAVGLEILNAMEKAQPQIFGKMQREAASDPLKES